MRQPTAIAFMVLGFGVLTWAKLGVAKDGFGAIGAILLSVLALACFVRFLRVRPPWVDALIVADLVVLLVLPTQNPSWALASLSALAALVLAHGVLRPFDRQPVTLMSARGLGMRIGSAKATAAGFTFAVLMLPHWLQSLLPPRIGHTLEFQSPALLVLLGLSISACVLAGHWFSRAFVKEIEHHAVADPREVSP